MKINADAILYPGQGYFTVQDKDCNLIINGYRFTVELLGRLGTHNIKTGWNMIGAPSEQVNNFDYIKGSCIIESGPYLGKVVQYPYIEGEQQYVQTQILQLGKGYFIYATNNCNLKKT